MKMIETSLGALHRQEALEWMAGLPASRARLVIADPPYNIGKAGWDRFPSIEAYLEWTRDWVGRAHRLLADDGTLYICGFPEEIARIAAVVGPLFHSWRCLAWHYRNKANMSHDWGRSHESLLHLRKAKRMVFNTDDVRIPYNRHTVRYPERAQAETSQYGRAAVARWRPHPAGARPRDVIEVPTLCNGSAEKTAHPTQKPAELIRRLVLASSNPGDLVIDPFGGSGTTYTVCEETGRRWLGCERDESYCRIIQERLAHPDRHRASLASESAEQKMRRRAQLRGAQEQP